MHTMCVCEPIAIGYDMHVALGCTVKHLKLLNPPFPHAGPHADSVVVGITLTCVVLLFLIALTAAGNYFVYKSATVKKDYLW